MEDIDEETLLAKAAEIQKARDKIKEQARNEKMRKEKEAFHQELVARVKTVLGDITVIEGQVFVHEGDYNYGERYVQEFNEYLDTLPMLRHPYGSNRGCILKITVEVIGPAEEEEE